MTKTQKTKSEKKGRKILLKIFLVLVILGLIGVAVLGVMNIYMISDTKANVYSLEAFESGDVSENSHYQAVIVLGCAIWGDVPSPMLADRLRTAASVYKTGCCDYVLVSGDSADPDKYDETGVMAEFLVNEGVPREKIFCDQLGLSTYESMNRALKVYHIDTAVVVTTGFHVPRSVYDARSFGIEAVGVEAINSGYVIKLYNYFREFVARGKDLVFTIIKPDNDFIGSVL